MTFTLRRVGATPTIGYITCKKIVGVQVHYWRGRTRPHLDPGPCEACQDGNSPRWKGYLTLFDPRRKEHWLQEITPAAYDGIRAGIDAYGDIRGHQMQLERTRPKANAPMKATIFISVLDLRTLPPEPDIPQILLRIWDLSKQANPPSIATDRTTAHLALGAKPNGRHS